MKSLLVILATVFCLNSHATNISGEVVDVIELCPKGMMCITNGTILNIKFQLPNPCYSVSDLKVDEKSNSQIAVEAVLNAPSAKVACPAVISEEVKSVTLNMIFPPFNLEFVGTPDVVQVLDYTTI